MLLLGGVIFKTKKQLNFVSVEFVNYRSDFKTSNNFLKRNVKYSNVCFVLPKVKCIVTT